MLPAYIHFPSTPTLNFQQNQSKYVFISDCSDLRARFRSLMRMYVGPGPEALMPSCVSIFASNIFSTPSLFPPLSLLTLCREAVRATSGRSGTSPCSRGNLQLEEQLGRREWCRFVSTHSSFCLHPKYYILFARAHSSAVTTIWQRKC